MTDKYRVFIDNFVHWGEATEGVRAALVVGSQAREDFTADEYSDLDIVMFVDEPEYFISSDHWLDELGKYHVAFVENTMDGAKEKRVIFDGMLDVDIVIQPCSLLDAVSNVEAAIVLLRGYDVLVDKIGLSERLEPLSGLNTSYELPTEEEFINIVNDFWYHTVWTSKKLSRGELWTSKNCMDSYMKWKLLALIEYHAKATHGKEYDTWYSGRFIEQWADKRIVDELSHCFALYDADSIRKALLSTMSLFRNVALEVAGKLGYRYPVSVDEYTTACVTAITKQNAENT